MASTATKRPTYSSRSVTSRLAGLATVTCGAGGGAPLALGWLPSQPASPAISKSSAAGTVRDRSNLGSGMRFPAWMLDGALQQYGVELPRQQKGSRGREPARSIFPVAYGSGALPRLQA